MIPWLAPGQPFPPVSAALQAPNGLLAASADVTPDRLLAAYPKGIFPWYSAEEPVLWWSPDPRMVLFTDEFRVSRSLAKKLRKAATDASIELRFNSDFAAVIQACAQPRGDDAGTWITDHLADAYTELHYRGFAHSMEMWVRDRLAGGLYGVALGRMFYGESMFSRISDASKIALAVLVRVMQIERVPVIDCQQNTRHLASLGAREIPRGEFVAHLNASVRAAPISWTAYAGRRLNMLLADFA